MKESRRGTAPAHDPHRTAAGALPDDVHTGVMPRHAAADADFSSRAWVRAPLSPAMRAAELAASERLARRDWRRDMAIAVAECFVSLGVGLWLIAWSLHTTDQRLGDVAMLSGAALGNAGLLLSLIRAHARAVERGDL